MIADGPFAESKEAIGGYFYITVADENEAIEIAKQCPGLEYGSVVEVRPVADVCSIKERAEEYSARFAGARSLDRRLHPPPVDVDRSLA